MNKYEVYVKNPTHPKKGKFKIVLATDVRTDKDYIKFLNKTDIVCIFPKENVEYVLLIQKDYDDSIEENEEVEVDEKERNELKKKLNQDIPKANKEKAEDKPKANKEKAEDKPKTK